MAERPAAVRGMRDVLPAEADRRRHLAETIYATYARFGYRQIETPAVEDLRWLESGQGGENEKLIFKILKRGVTETDGLDIGALSGEGLRFDLTVPLARFYASNAPALPTPFRVFQLGPVWRAERPQRGRWRQFTQCDIDIIGEPSPLAETELITATCKALDTVGLTGYRVRLNDRRLLNALVEVCGFSALHAPDVLIAIDKIDKIGMDGVTQALRDAGHPTAAIDMLTKSLGSAAGATDITAFIDLVGALAPTCKDTLEQLSTIIGAVDPGSGTLIPDLSLVRGMGYYTGTIFEIDAPGLNASIGGGGRYDGMIGRFTKNSAPACGFSLGFERLAEVLPSAAGSPTQQRIALLRRPDQSLADVMADASRLREHTSAIVEIITITGRGKGTYKRLVANGFDLVADALTGQPPRPLNRDMAADAET